MKARTWHVFICAAMVLSACGLARADERDSGCRLKTLSRRVRVLRNGVQHRRWRRATESHRRSDRFQRYGTLSVPAATLSANGVIIRSLPGGFGTYTIEDDSYSTITFNGPAFDTFISRDGDTIQMIQTNPGTVFQGTATRQSREHDRR